ncbi:MAG: hypothetical protein JO288_08150 [Hyphomicrobiales bacterium]|nr:hypothetical protein [Hyphomicrobiales bacterium]
MAKGAKLRKTRKAEAVPEPLSEKKVLRPEIEELRLSPADARALMTICVQLLDFCAHVCGKIDPTAAMMVTWARDEVTIPMFGYRA